MSKKEYLGICRQLFNSITVVKGFTQLKGNSNNVDYSFMVLHETEHMEALIIKLVDLINEDGKDS